MKQSKTRGSKAGTAGKTTTTSTTTTTKTTPAMSASSSKPFSSSTKKSAPKTTRTTQAGRNSLEKFKMEAASEVGVQLKNGYNGNLTSRQAGAIGGRMVKKMIDSYKSAARS